MRAAVIAGVDASPILTIDAINMMNAEEIAHHLSGPPEARAAFVRVAAEAGVADAQAVYGQMLLDGEGVPANPHEAVRWFSLAAAQEQVMAINMLGRWYDLGWGVAVDKARAVDHYRRAAEDGDFRGQFNHARMLADAGRVDEALIWLAKRPEAATESFIAKVADWLAASDIPIFRDAAIHFVHRRRA